MPIYSLKNRKQVDSRDRLGLINRVYKDKDGYYKTEDRNGNIAVLPFDKNGKPIKHKYIGGTTEESRTKYWEQYPIMNHAVDSIANEYNISSFLLRDRLNKEGFVDNAIRRNNNGENTGTYEELNKQSITTGFGGFGLDDVYTYIQEGKVKPINEKYEDEYHYNEKDRKVHSAHGIRTKDNIGLTAATLKYMRNTAAKDFPKANRFELDEIAGIYYNRGIAGGRKYIKENTNNSKFNNYFI